ncbi:MAG TPA: N-acetylmuramoyl-L-alanine amidase [Bacillota bacterium]|nr:N-acetylmuramoyl-L-alanine amidase [Bacillota bacterium]
MNSIERKGSPHYYPDVRREAQPPDQPPLIVLHTMDGYLEGTLAWFQNPESEVSSHYGIGRKGEIHQYVQEKDGAWTNGRVVGPTSTQINLRGGDSNRYTITIEFEGKDKGGAIDAPQYQAGLWLICQIASRWHVPLTREYIIGHYEIDSINKINCPGPFFPWAKLMADLTSEKGLVSIRSEGKPISLGYLDHGTTYAPIRSIMEYFGFQVSWDEQEHVIDIQK